MMGLILRYLKRLGVDSLKSILQFSRPFPVQGFQLLVFSNITLGANYVVVHCASWKRPKMLISLIAKVIFCTIRVRILYKFGQRDLAFTD